MTPHPPPHPHARSTSRSRGLSLVELLVGLAVGLLVLSAATAFAMHQLREIGRLQAQTQLQQTLRAAADLVLRDLRRAAHWPDAGTSLAGAATTPSAPNPWATLQWDAQTSTLGYAHADAGLTGVRLRQRGLQMLMGGSGWQSLTDVAAVEILRFDVRLATTTLPLPCTRPCPAGDSACPPVQIQRTASLSLHGRATQQPDLQRRIESQVALPNDIVVGRCPA